MSEQDKVDQWNQAHPVGTEVTRYKRINPLREPQDTKTRSEAYLMGGHTAVVLVSGVSGAVILQSLVVKPPVAA